MALHSLTLLKRAYLRNVKIRRAKKKRNLQNDEGVRRTLCRRIVLNAAISVRN